MAESMQKPKERTQYSYFAKHFELLAKKKEKLEQKATQVILLPPPTDHEVSVC
jgi:hypothetical protein